MNNYSTHVQEYFARPDTKLAYRRAYPRSYPHIQQLVSTLATAEKFQMPDYGRIFSPGTKRGDFRDLLRLPYPVCALEYCCPKKLRDNALGIREHDYFPTRRIALCLDTDKLHSVEFPMKGIIVLSLFEAYQGEWIIAPLGAFMSPDTMKYNEETGLFTFMPVPMMPEAFSRGNYTEDMGILDVQDEVIAAVDFMMAINCENVTRERIAAPEKLNKKRMASGKPPFSSYWMLDIFKESFAKQPAQGGTHDSPRLHFRRGHLRRLASGRAIWVRHTMVGNPDRGVVEKTYNLTKGAS